MSVTVERSEMKPLAGSRTFATHSPPLPTSRARCQDLPSSTETSSLTCLILKAGYGRPRKTVRRIGVTAPGCALLRMSRPPGTNRVILTGTAKTLCRSRLDAPKCQDRPIRLESGATGTAALGATRTARMDTLYHPGCRRARKYAPLHPLNLEDLTNLPCALSATLTLAEHSLALPTGSLNRPNSDTVSGSPMRNRGSTAGPGPRTASPITLV